MSRLQACCPFPLLLLHVVPGGGTSLERKLHKRFSPFRLHGEWFDNSRKVMGYVALHPVGVRNGVKRG